MVHVFFCYNTNSIINYTYLVKKGKIFFEKKGKILIPANGKTYEY
jgi:hypothetical protein